MTKLIDAMLAGERTKGYANNQPATPITDAMESSFPGCRSNLAVRHFSDLARKLEADLADLRHNYEVLREESRAEAERERTLVLQRDTFSADRAALVAALRHIDGIANFMAATGKDREQWEQVQAHCATLARVRGPASPPVSYAGETNYSGEKPYIP